MSRCNAFIFSSFFVILWGHNENLMRNIIVLSNKIRGLGIIPNKHFCIFATSENIKNLASGRTDAMLAILQNIEKTFFYRMNFLK